MKKFKAIIFCTAILLLCGCTMKAEYKMEIKDDKSMTFSATTAMDDELLEGLLSMSDMDGEEEVEYTDEDKWAYLESSKTEEPAQSGFTEERYEEGNFKGYTYTKKINNIDDISGDTANFTLEDFMDIDNKVVFVKNGETYKASFLLSSEGMSEETDGYNIGMDYTFVVTLPNKPISHNATSVSKDGKTLTWNLTEVGSKNIEFEFSFEPANEFPIVWVAVGAGIIVLVAVVAVIISKNKKNNVVQQMPPQTM